jgi:hypothetical protein
MPIVLRLLKGSELTFAELDGNFTNLDNRLDEIEEANLNSRVTRLEQAGTPIYFDSDDVMVMLDSIWAGGVDSFLATTDSIGLARFDADYFSVDSGLVTLSGGFNDPINLAVTVDNPGVGNRYYVDGVLTPSLTLYEGNTYRFDQSDPTNDGHPLRISATSNGTHSGGVAYTKGVIIKGTAGDSNSYTQLTITGGAPKLYYYCNVHSGMGGVINTHSGQLAGTTITDSAGIASFDSAQFNVSTDGHVTHNEIYLDSAVRSRLSAIDNGGAGSFTYRDSTGQFIYTGAPDASTSTKGIASFNSSDFTVSSGVVSLASSGAAFSTTFNGIGSLGFFMVSGGSAAVGGTIAGSNLKYGTANTDGSGHRVNQIAVNNSALYNDGVGQTPQFTAMSFKRVTGSSEASPSGTWRNLGPGYAASGGQKPYQGHGLNLFVRVS